MPHYFITATDTDSGKTFVAAKLLQVASLDGLKCFGFKPIASGCELTDAGLRNDDALKIKAAGSLALPYEAVNLYSFKPAIAPHIAAKNAGEEISLDKIVNHYQALRASNAAELSIVEGVGGWQVPLSDNWGIPELADKLRLPIIVVVKIKLGCINHALLTLESIQHKGLEIKGWVANAVLDDEVSRANISAIQQRTTVPLLGQISLQKESEDKGLSEQQYREFGELLNSIKDARG